MESIVVEAKLDKRKRKELKKELKKLGFDSLKEKQKEVIAEKELGDETVDYQVIFKDNEIVFSYALIPKVSPRRRKLELLPVLLNILVVVGEFYTVSFSFYKILISSFRELQKAIDKDAVDLSAQRDSIHDEHKTLTKKYDETLKSNEQNVKLLLEYETKNGELAKRVKELESMSDEILKEEVYKWIKLHNGSIELAVFCRAHSVVPSRVEEVLSELAREGYIKRIG